MSSSERFVLLEVSAVHHACRPFGEQECSCADNHGVGDFRLISKSSNTASPLPTLTPDFAELMIVAGFRTVCLPTREMRFSAFLQPSALQITGCLQTTEAIPS